MTLDLASTGRLSPVLLLLAGCSGGESADAVRPGATFPNVLMIVVDDLNDWTGRLGGHAAAETPHLDRLMDEGISFESAHAAAPVCIASRHAVLTGLAPTTSGIYGASIATVRAFYQHGLERQQGLDGESGLGKVVPLPDLFDAAGYHTMAAGKIHHMGVSDLPRLANWDESRPGAAWPEALARRGHGYQSPAGGHYYPFPEDGGAAYRAFGAVRGQALAAGPMDADDIHPDGMPDTQIADWAIERLGRTYEAPFLLAVGFIRPHLPYTAPREYFDAQPFESLTVPEVPQDELVDVPELGRAMTVSMLPDGDHQHVLDQGEEYWRELVHAYLACVRFVDAEIGRVLAALDASEHGDDTIVVLWSDHGQHLGEKLHWRKTCLWEESTRVPFVIRLPPETKGLGDVRAAAGARCSRTVSLLDLYPTLADLCGLGPLPWADGVSLRPLLQDPSAPWDRPAVTTWLYGNHAVRSEHWRYIRYRDGTEELYDRRADPGEHENLAGDAWLGGVIDEHRRWLPYLIK